MKDVNGKEDFSGGSERVGADYPALSNKLDVWDCWKRAWEIMRQNPFMTYILFIGAHAAALIFAAFLVMILLILGIVHSLTDFLHGGSTGAVIAAAVMFCVAAGYVWLISGVTKIMLDLSQGRSPGFGTFTEILPKFPALLTIAFVSATLVLLGLPLLLLPGIYAAVVLSQALMLALESDQGLDALSESRKLVKGNEERVFLLTAVNLIVLSASSFFPPLTLALAPMAMLSHVAAFRRLIEIQAIRRGVDPLTGRYKPSQTAYFKDLPYGED